MVRESLALLAGAALVASAANSQSYKGYPCTKDCSGHEAGYEWAERKDVTDPDDCSGNSNSFIEGCRAWAEEQSPRKASGGDAGDQGDGKPVD